MDRRKFIHATGALGTVGFMSTVNAESDGKVSLADVGIKEEVAGLLREGKNKQARKLLESNNIRYSAKSASVGSRVDDGNFGTEGHYAEGSSNLYLTFVDANAEGRWLATGSGTLSNRKLSTRDAAIVDDACGLYFDSTEWTALGYDYVWTLADSDGSYGAEMSIADFEPNHGVSCSVELPPQLDASTTVSCQMELVKNEDTGNDNVPVYFEYDHTWAWLADDSFADIFVEVIDSTLGTLGLDLQEAEVLWDENMSTMPE